jgi:NADH:ubiquinone oxidoreductase subunit 4 (subunit M)
MLRAYRKTFTGTVREQWEKLPDLSPALRVPITLLVAALLCYGFFPQSLVQMVAPKIKSVMSSKVERSREGTPNITPRDYSTSPGMNVARSVLK